MRKRQLCMICLPVLIWLILMGFYSAGISETISLPVKEGSTIQVQGTICKMESDDSGQLITLKNISYISEVSSQFESLRGKTQWKVLVYLKEQAEVNIGNRVQVEGVCAFFDMPDNPGGFDSDAYYKAQNIIFSVKKAFILKNLGKTDYFMQALYDLRRFCSSKIDGICEENTAAILKAMILGEKGDLEKQTKELFQKGGIIHILAISGLHISLLGMGLYKILRKFGTGFGAACAAAGIVMIGFGLMTGFAPSAKRAVIMFLIFLGSQLAGRSYDMPNALMVSAVLVLLQNPLLITQAGFLLSFGAVAGVMASDIWTYPWMKKSGLAVSISTWLFTLPLVAWFYFQIPLYGIILNLIVIPLMPIVMLSGLLGIVAGVFLQGAGMFCQAPAHYILEGIQGICRVLEMLPGAGIVLGKPSAVQIGIYYLFLLIFYFFFRKKRKIDLLQRVFGIILVISILCGSIPKNWTMTFLNVGQGDGICIRMPHGSVWMIDGGSSDRSSLAEYDIEPYLLMHGIDLVDCWLVSHFDQDHVSGLLEILNGYRRNLSGRNAKGITIGQILIPDTVISEDEGSGNELQKQILLLAEKNNIPVKAVFQGMVLKQENTVFQFLAPQRNLIYEDRNEASVVVEIQYRDFKAILTGDVEKNGEDILIREERLSDVDFLKVAHHGSKNGTTEEFLRIVRPEAAVVSCGKNNRYGHPHIETLSRLDKYGCNVFRTDECGPLDVIVNDDSWYIAKAR